MRSFFYFRPQPDPDVDMEEFWLEEGDDVSDGEAGKGLVKDIVATVGELPAEDTKNIPTKPISPNDS